jgi:hypothetical protein
MARELCECGKGYVVFLKDGTRSCTADLARYRALYGEPKYLLLGLDAL